MYQPNLLQRTTRTVTGAKLSADADFLELIKAHLRLPSLLVDTEMEEAFVEDDATIKLYIDGAVPTIEGLTTLSLVPSDFVLFISGIPRARNLYGSIELLWGPVVEITSVRYIDGDMEEQTLSPDQYGLEPDVPDWSSKSSFVSFFSCFPCVTTNLTMPIRVHYKAGMTELFPDAATLAIAQLIAWYYRSREAFGSIPSSNDMIGRRFWDTIETIRSRIW